MGLKDEYDIPVFVDGVEKLMTGLNKRTTCDDVIYAILQNLVGGSGSDIDCEVANYVICEKWRHLERPLRGRTKLVKAWRAWASEKHNVKFILHRLRHLPDDVSSIASIDKPGNVRRKRTTRRKSREDLVSRRYEHSSKEDIEDENELYWNMQIKSHNSVTYKDYGYLGPSDKKQYQSNARLSSATSSEKARTFEKSSQDENSGDKYSQESFLALVQQVVNQEKVLHDQMDRIKQTDKDILALEKSLQRQQFESVSASVSECSKAHEGSDDSGVSTEDILNVVPVKDLDEYIDVCEDILTLEKHIAVEDEKIENLSLQIMEESYFELEDIKLNKTSETYEETEEDKLRSQLEECLTKGMSCTDQIYSIRTKLTMTEEQLRVKNHHIEEILKEIGEDDSNTLPPTALVKHVRFETDKNQHLNYYRSSPNGNTSEQIKHLNTHKTNNMITRAPVNPTCWNGSNRDMFSNPAVVSSQKLNFNNNVTSHSVTLKDVYDAKLCKYKQIKNDLTTIPDSESDTGLSSMHSDDCQRVLETLV